MLAGVVAQFLEDIQAYIGFGEADGERLRSLHPMLSQHFESIADHFYACILRHDGAHSAITGGDAQVQRLKRTLVAWMDSGLRGPWDEAFFERRARIGRKHVEIGLPQQYMVTAIGVMRQDYHATLREELAEDRAGREAAIVSIDRLLDIELAIMLQTYRIDSDDELRRNERLATIGMVAASIGHDLRNPLGVIESSAYILRRLVDDDRGQRHLDKIVNQVRSCNRIVTALLELAKSRPPRFAPVEAKTVVNNALAMMSTLDGIEVRVEVTPGLLLHADAGLLEQAIINLVVNAAHAIGRNRGAITIQIAPHDADFNAIVVQDDGPGFDPEVLPKVFEPLVTTRASGVGLGLALVRSVAERHRGRAQAENATGGGALVRLLLPSREAQIAPES
ncbi:MAG: histidine kinase [Deltaproteobacteria bacterium]|nr:histidine kinase [Deltaproteobacteria bacterium]